MDIDVKLGAAIISALAAIIIGSFTLLHNKRVLKEQKRSEKRRIILEKLNEFYGPLLSYSNITKGLHDVIVKGKPKSFRILTYLLDREQQYKDSGETTKKVIFNETDEVLVSEIVEIEKKIEDLIISKAGLIDDKELMFQYIPNPEQTDITTNGHSLLSLAIMHFRVFRIAYQGKSQGDVERLRNFVYPRELPKKLMNRITALQNELDNLTN